MRHTLLTPVLLLAPALAAAAQPPSRISVDQISSARTPPAQPIQVPSNRSASNAPSSERPSARLSCPVDLASAPASQQEACRAQQAADAQASRSSEGALLEVLGRPATVTTSSEGSAAPVINADAVARQLSGSGFQEPDAAASGVARDRAAAPPPTPNPR